MSKIRSFGVTVYVGNDTVGALTDASISGGEVTFVDLTTHDSTGGYREFISGLKDGGSLDLTGKYDFSDSGQVAIMGGLGTTESCSVILSDNSGMTFDAVIGGFNTGNPLDDSVEFTSSLKITGAITDIFPTMTVTGTLTSDGSTPLVFPAMTVNGTSNGRIGYASGTYGLEYTGSGWQLYDSATGAEWLSSSDTLTPDLATGWTPSGTETGTPTITAS